jgi:glycosyltransferase involved in cell wall biosynthesis
VAILATRMGDLNGVLLTGETDGREGSLEPAVRAAGATVVKVPGLRRRPDPIHDLAAFVYLYRYFRRTRPRIVATHMAKAGAVGRLAAFAAGVPVTVHTFHGHVLEAYFSRPVAAFYRTAERWLGRRTTHLVAVSEEIARDLERLGIGAGNVSVVRLGLDLDRFVAGSSATFRQDLRVAPDVPLVGIVGRLVPVKDHATFLRAAALLRQEIPNVEFAIVGDGELWDHLHDLSRELGLERVVHFTGWREDLDAVYAGLDVVVLTSRNEGTPVSLIEAAAAGRPVVATNVGGVRTVVEDGASGLLYGAGDAAGLKRGIASIILDPELAGRLGETGRRLSFERFGAERMIEELRSLYGRLLEHQITLQGGTRHERG